MAKRRKSPGGTRATELLTARGTDFEVLEYEIESNAVEPSLGEAAAAALGVPPEASFKTLIAEVDGSPVCAVVPVTHSLSLKALAAAAGGKRATMASVALAERVTGYVTGGISPLGQTQALPIFLDATLTNQSDAYISAGKRGLELRLASGDLVDATAGTLVPGLAV